MADMTRDQVFERSSHAMRLRGLGRLDEADALFPMPSVCACLAPVEAYVRSLGVHVVDVSSPWSKNCRNWVSFDDVVLDGPALIKRFALPATIVVHTHRGTHDGAEQGLVCELHHDALIGAHPDLAKGAKTIR